MGDREAFGGRFFFFNDTATTEIYTFPYTTLFRSAIVPFRTVEEAIHIYNDTEYGFALSVITEDFRKARQVRLGGEHGVGYWNLPTIGAEVHMPFGGLKASGTGMPSAAALIDAVTHKTSWTVHHGETIQMAQG